MDIQNYIDTFYHGLTKKFADDIGVLPQQVTKWKKNQNIIIDNVIYAPLRIIKKHNESVNSISELKLNSLINILQNLKYPNSGSVSEHRQHEYQLQVNYNFDDRKAELIKKIDNSFEIINPLMIALEYQSKFDSVKINIDDDQNKKCLYLTLSGESKAHYVMEIYRDLFVHYLRSNKFDTFIIDLRKKLIALYKYVEYLATCLDSKAEGGGFYHKLVTRQKHILETDCTNEELIQAIEEQIGEIASQHT